MSLRTPSASATTIEESRHCERSGGCASAGPGCGAPDLGRADGGGGGTRTIGLRGNAGVRICGGPGAGRGRRIWPPGVVPSLRRGSAATGGSRRPGTPARGDRGGFAKNVGRRGAGPPLGAFGGRLRGGGRRQYRVVH